MRANSLLRSSKGEEHSIADSEDRQAVDGHLSVADRFAPGCVMTYKEKPAQVVQVLAY